jgi:hypothetical protein
MRMKTFWAGLILALSTAITSVVAHAEGVTVTKGGAPALSGQIVTFTITDSSGNILGEVSVPAQDALGSSLATFFQSVADSIREVIAAVQNQAEGELNTASKTTMISNRVGVQVTTTGYGLGSSGGGGGGSAGQPASPR